MADTRKLVPVTMLSEQAMVRTFNKKVAEAFGSMQIIVGSLFIGLSLSALYYGLTLFSQISMWFSIFWVLGGTTHIMAGHSKHVSLIRATLLFSIISLISTLIYITIIGYQVARYALSDTAIGIYSGMLAGSVIEGTFSIMAIVHCAKALCTTYKHIKHGQVDPMHTDGGATGAQQVPMVLIQHVPLVGMATSAVQSSHSNSRHDTTWS